MSLKTSLFLFCALGVIGYATYDYATTEKREETKKSSEKIIKIDEESVVSFSVKKKDSVEIKLIKDGKVWKISDPISEEANQSEASSFLGDVLGEGRTAVVKSGPDIDWSIYGLDFPNGQVSVASANSVTTVLVGKKNFKGEPYLKVEGVDEVLTGNNMWAIKIEQQLKDFRNRRVFKGALTSLDEISIQNNAVTIPLKKLENKWAFADQIHKNFPVDPLRVQEFVTQLQAIEGTDIVAEGEKFELFKKALQLKKSTLSLKVNEDKFSFLENIKGEKFVESSQEKKIYKIVDSDFKKFKDYDFSNFRNRREAFSFSTDPVKKIQIDFGNGKPEAFVKSQSSSWDWEQAKPHIQFNPEKIESLLKNLSSFEAFEFKVSQSEVKKPVFEVELLAGEGSKPIVFKIFPEIVLPVRDEKFKVNEVISSLSPYPVYLKAETVLSLGFSDILTEKAKQ